MAGFCKHCGKELKDDEPYCPECGMPAESAFIPQPYAPKKNNGPVIVGVIVIVAIVILSIVGIAIVSMLVDTGPSEKYTVTVTVESVSIDVADGSYYGPVLQACLSISCNSGGSTVDHTFGPWMGILSNGTVNCKQLVLLASSEKAGASVIRSKDNKFIFITGHAEYDRETLEKEYLRDVEKGLDIAPPENYYVDKVGGKINMCWASTANLIYMNWLNHFVYQITPYNIEEIK